MFRAKSEIYTHALVIYSTPVSSECECYFHSSTWFLDLESLQYKTQSLPTFEVHYHLHFNVIVNSNGMYVFRQWTDTLWKQHTCIGKGSASYTHALAINRFTNP